ncbi:hypothetical protein [Cutibacterium granulosum]|nr:hypothetical protein [Cutibacterium granulosum]
MVKSDVYVVCGSHGFFSNWGESGGSSCSWLPGRAKVGGQTR